jgi:hypothetical protein
LQAIQIRSSRSTMPEQCEACEAELATVFMDYPDGGRALLGPNCVRRLKIFARLLGRNLQQRPAMRLVR